MPKLIDLTGQRFGRWTVLKRGQTRNKMVYWVCQCDCGTIREVKGNSLRRGQSKSCGCLQKEISKEKCSQIGKQNLKDLTGQKFGDWTILKDSGRRRSNGSVIWLCQCTCGTIRGIRRQSLITGYSKNCGCKKISSKGELKIYNLLTEEEIPFIHEKTFESCRFEDSQRLAKFDFYVDNKYIIEYDGEQHFINKSSKSSYFTEERLKKIKEHDKIKTLWCKQNNIPLIRIPYNHYDTLCLQDLLLKTSSFIV